MFFRRAKPSNPSPAQRLDALRQAGFTVGTAQNGISRVSRGEFALDLKEADGSLRPEGRAGVLIGGDIASLVDGGYQKFFRTAAGKQRPALADDLKALHDLEEDVKEALGLESLYNESLGTVSTFYLYDRVQNRDAGVPKRAWETK